MMLSVVPVALTSLGQANTSAAATIAATASTEPAAMLGAAEAALGPIGGVYLAAYGPAEANNMAGGLLVGDLRAAIPDSPGRLCNCPTVTTTPFASTPAPAIRRG
jgi:hypothetical protein